ncbi:hypothetical protein WAF17_07155 [Bernardetia sp. ABR2-2B]|uniref:hypothetical protein n=1 Tax=Bernardetia sp. ABR2-2B TaxID=3127472 RepID=UPI0030CF6EC4
MENSDINTFHFENDCFVFDTTTFPQIFVKFKTPQPNKKQFYEYLDCMDTIFLQENKYVVLIELNGSEYLKAEFREKQAEWNNKHHQHMREYCQGMANISHSQEQITIVKAIMKSYPPPSPILITDTREKAEHWLANKMPLY